MAEQIQLTKQVYDKNQYQKVIDTSFTQLVQPTTQITGSVLPSVNQWIGYWVRITAGAGSPNGSTGAINPLLQITSNTATTLTLSGVFATTPPDTTSSYSIEGVLASGVATSGSTTTLVNSTKSGGSAWTTNQWTNSRVRITGGTGLGQTSIIASNTGDTLTIGTVGTAIASGSIYEIEGDENFIYLAGNAAVAMYKYSISAGTWGVWLAEQVWFTSVYLSAISVCLTTFDTNH